jgi:site-specific DNA recombinase
MRAAIYARYSSDNQRDASVEDQIRLCKERIKREGWRLEQTYTDRAISGASLLRPGYQKLLQDIRSGKIDVVVAEALDRISRDQEHVAALFKQASFAGISLVTLAEGEISELHVGLKGTMNALFLKDLADKTRRGLRGRVEEGKSGGGLCYGYQVKREFDSRGEPIRGGREINPAEADVVRQIFKAFASGESPQAIAKRLNHRGVPGPQDKTWGPSTIYGNWRRGTGILNNELYIGRMVWNRLRYVKDPSSGKRVSKLNPQSMWVLNNLPELRIVDQELWESVKKRQGETRLRVTATNRPSVRAERAKRPVYLLSGLIRCGVCGGGFTMTNVTHYACNAARNKGTCKNTLSIRRDKLESAVLDGLRANLMKPKLVEEFVEEYHREINRLSGQVDIERQQKEKDLHQAEQAIRVIIESIKAGFRTDSMRDELEVLEAKKKELKKLLSSPKPSPVRLHPNLASVYRQKVANLREALNREDTRLEAAGILRELIEEIRLVPEKGVLRVHLVGHLANLLAFGQNKKPGLKETGLQVTLVAGAGSVRDRTVLVRRFA